MNNGKEFANVVCAMNRSIVEYLLAVSEIYSAIFHCSWIARTGCIHGYCLADCFCRKLCRVVGWADRLGDVARRAGISRVARLARTVRSSIITSLSLFISLFSHLKGILCLCLRLERLILSP